MREKKYAFVIILILLLGLVGAYSGISPTPVESEYALDFYPTTTDTIYLLPQQFLWYGISVRQRNYIENIGAIELRAYTSDNNIPLNEPEYTWMHPDYGFTIMEGAVYYLSHESGSWIYRVIFGKTLKNNFWVGQAYYRNKMPVGESFSNWYYSIIVSGDPREYYLLEHKTIVSIDGYLGDVDGNEVVNTNDLNLLISHNSDFYEEGYYTKEGLNYGRGSILFRSCATILDAYILNVWLNDPNDPRIIDLGIGKLMSENQLSTLIDADGSLTGTKLSITTEGDAVNVTALSSDGKMWQKASWVTNNQATIEVPDPTWSYKIEAVKLPGSALALKNEALTTPATYSLRQNYPNPFNPTTTIYYSIPQSGLVNLRVFDLQGRLVTTLVNEKKVAGEYQICFDATDLATGTYLYQIRSGNFCQTKKMLFIK